MSDTLDDNDDIPFLSIGEADVTDIQFVSTEDFPDRVLMLADVESVPCEQKCHISFEGLKEDSFYEKHFFLKSLKVSVKREITSLFDGDKERSIFKDPNYEIEKNCFWEKDFSFLEGDIQMTHSHDFLHVGGRWNEMVSEVQNLQSCRQQIMHLVANKMEENLRKDFSDANELSAEQEIASGAIKMRVLFKKSPLLYVSSGIQIVEGGFSVVFARGGDFVHKEEESKEESK